MSTLIALAAGVALAGCGTEGAAPFGVTGSSEVAVESDGPAPSAAPSAPQVGEGGLSLAPLPPDPAFVPAVRATCLAEMVADPAIPLIVHDQRRADLAALYFEGPDEYLVVLVERRADGTFACLEASSGTLRVARHNILACASG